MNQETKGGYEPDRIPPSVFTPTVTQKQEWSMQSNESLFSIHIADQSFSNMYKSGDLTNFEYTAPTYYTNNTNNNNNNSNNFGSTEAAGIKGTIPKTAPKPNPPQEIPVSPAKSYRSDTSNTSAASFAFPTLQDQYQEDQKKSIDVKSESGKTEISRPDSKAGLHTDDPKPAGGNGGGGWLSCFFCFPVKD